MCLFLCVCMCTQHIKIAYSVNRYVNVCCLRLPVALYACAHAYCCVAVCGCIIVRICFPLIGTLFARLAVCRYMSVDMRVCVYVYVDACMSLCMPALISVYTCVAAILPAWLPNYMCAYVLSLCNTMCLIISVCTIKSPHSLNNLLYVFFLKLYTCMSECVYVSFCMYS